MSNSLALNIYNKEKMIKKILDYYENKERKTIEEFSKLLELKNKYANKHSKRLEDELKIRRSYLENILNSKKNQETSLIDLLEYINNINDKNNKNDLKNISNKLNSIKLLINKYEKILNQ
jgi:hypothetical protein